MQKKQEQHSSKVELNPQPGLDREVIKAHRKDYEKILGRKLSLKEIENLETDRELDPQVSPSRSKEKTGLSRM